MKERPLLYTGEMVRATIEARKTMTRRVIRFPKHLTDRYTSALDVHQETVSVNRDGGGNWVAWSPYPSTDEFTAEAYPNGEGFPCPYGRPGDRLWVRETWAPEGDEGAVWFKAGIPDYRAGEKIGWLDFPYRLDRVIDPPSDIKWKPSIFMPRWASRLTLEITAVRVERLQEITEKDAKAEGAVPYIEGLCTESPYDYFTPTMYRDGFKRLWDSINGEKYPWSGNWWVWVIEFKRVL